MTLSIWVPVGYIGALVLSLSLFSSVYRKRSARNAAKGSEEPWHPEGHPERDIYQSLISASTSGVELPDHLLKAALLNRAMTDVRRIIQMRDDKQALAVLLQKGSVGDATMARFALAEKELEAEILDVVSEANTFREGWGQLIFPTASEMVTHKKHKEVYYSIPEERNKQIALLKAQNKPIPKPTIELPPLFTPPGTQVKVHAQQQQLQPQGPPGAAGAAGVPLPPGMSPAQMQQIIQAQRAARSQQLGQAPPGQGDATAAAPVHGPPRPPTGPAAVAAGKTTNGGTTTPPVVKAVEGDATATPVTSTATAQSPPLTPSSKGNSNGSAATAPATPAGGEDPAAAAAAAIGSESFDSTLDEDEEDEGGDSGDEGTAPAGTASPGGGANRAQRRQNKKKQKKGGKK